MQILYFEPAWDKTIAPADREKIIAHFHSQHLENDNQLSFLWEAINHKGNLLVTVLIHNRADTPLHFQDSVIAYYKDDKPVATGIFNLPLEIPKKSSMPWTFIFTHVNETEAPPEFSITNNT